MSSVSKCAVCDATKDENEVEYCDQCGRAVCFECEDYGCPCNSEFEKEETEK